MSKKHFIALANTVRDINNQIIRRAHAQELPLTAEWVCDLIEDELARFCAAQNGAFMRGRWVDFIHGECGPNGGTRR